MSPTRASFPLVCFTAYAHTGESASIASSLPDTTALVASLCAWYCSMVIFALPAVVHFFDRAVMSSTCTVAVCTAIFLPQASSGLIVAPVFAAHWVPAEKYDTMVACASRCLLTVNDETPMLYLPEPTPGMIASNFADCQSVVRPSLPATALNRSTSKPMTVLPSVSRYSLGAYDESVPTMIFPADLSAAGTFAASALSTADDAAGEPPPDPVSVPLDSLPQAASDTVKAAAAATPSTARRVGLLRNMTTP